MKPIKRIYIHVFTIIKKIEKSIKKNDTNAKSSDIKLICTLNLICHIMGGDKYYYTST